MKTLEQIFRDHQIPFLTDEPLKNWCTFRIGGTVPLFVEPSNDKEIALVMTETKKAGIPLLILGRGSNILFSDKGYSGVVLHLGKNMAHMSMVDDHTIYCQSGALLLDLCTFALEQGLTGIEPLYGIPGSVGGAVYMNAGAYGGETKDIAVSSTHVNAGGETGEFVGDIMDLSYRHSAYTDDDYVITGLTVRLEKGDPTEIKAKMDDFMGRRRDKQPLEHASAGSTFKRPEGYYASALIDECGLKGSNVGDAMVSTKHAGFVVNVGDASCDDVLGVINRVKETVLAKKGVQLDCEIKIIGE